ncbi:MAG: 16S rRNA (cytosine(1402)-N(4))-methyltransferase RsmH [Anaerolineales bacterium]|nr:16S rRNA (cytosine(1402)-N(4))-methyltransferase RsmH [Anaerolineales bacterium]
MNASSGAVSASGHTPVLYQNVLTALDLHAGGHYIDGTVGAGGHAAGILECSSPDGRLLGLDCDPNALELAELHLEPFGDRVSLRHASYTAMHEEASALGWDRVDAILLDLGLSSMQLGDPKRGFSFRSDGPLDMRFDPNVDFMADELVNHMSQDELVDVIKRYGEDPRARAIAEAIVQARPLKTTIQLAEVIASKAATKRKGIHPATRTFQALRIAVNDELETLKAGLETAVRLLSPRGRLAVISFHSLEDRIVKRFFRRESRDCICPPEQLICCCEHVATLRVLTKKPIRPESDEISHNPRARSARLRVAERLTTA